MHESIYMCVRKKVYNRKFVPRITYFQQKVVICRLIELHASTHEGQREMIFENTNYALTYKAMHQLIEEKFLLCADL